jgi:hypothetical protein
MKHFYFRKIKINNIYSQDTSFFWDENISRFGNNKIYIYLWKIYSNLMLIQTKILGNDFNKFCVFFWGIFLVGWYKLAPDR